MAIAFLLEQNPHMCAGSDAFVIMEPRLEEQELEQEEQEEQELC